MLTKQAQTSSNSVEYLLKSFGNTKRWKLEGQIFWRNKKLFLFLIAIHFIHGQMTNIAYYRHIQGPRLKDIGYDLIPYLSPDYHFLSEYLWITMFSIVVLETFVPFLHKNPSVHTVFSFSLCIFLCIHTHIQAVQWIRCMFVMAFCLIFRCFSFLATSLSGPAAHCQPMSESYHPPENIYDILFRMDVTGGCGDLIFSSHTSLSLCIIITFYVYGNPLLPKKLYQAIFYLILLPAEVLMMILIIAARKHYTVDVVIAMYTTPLVYYASYYFLSDEDISGIEDNESNEATYDYSIFPMYITDDDNNKLNAD